MTDADKARELIRQGIFALGAEVVQRPLVRGKPDSGMYPHPEPIAGIRAAVSLTRAATGIVRDCARYAREDGLSWSLIGEAMGYADDPQPGMTSVAEHAFVAVASDLGSGPAFGWTCPACGQVVLDRGPEMGHPADAERGHAEGCERFAATIAAWDAQWEDDGDGN